MNYEESIMKKLKNFDKTTYEHSVRVSLFSKQISSGLGFTEHELTEITKGALLHDIGKMYIPIDLLNKKEKLTEVEREMISLHSEMGYRKLLELDGSASEIVKAIVRYHHDPYEAKELLAIVQIINAIDIFDALTNERPYRSFIYGFNDAFEKMRSMVDPEVLKLFLKQREKK